MDKYRNNLRAMDNLMKTNRQLNDIDSTLKRKYLCRMKDLSNLQSLLNNSVDKYHNIIKNLDGFLS